MDSYSFDIRVADISELLATVNDWDAPEHAPMAASQGCPKKNNNLV